MPGPTLIFRCMRCGGEFLKRTISSGNTIRATYRSDGKMTAPMLPRPPKLAACPHCGEAIWFPEYQPIEKFDLYRDGNNFDALSGGEPSDLSDIPPVDEDKKRIEEEQRKAAKARAERLSSLHENTPTAGELIPEKCLLFIEARVLPEETEISLRKQVMHLVNDRRCSENDPILSPAESKNMHQLLELSKEDDESSVLLRAEIHRELGQFSAAKKELDRDFINGAKAEQLIRAVEAGDILPFQFATGGASHDYEYAWEMRRYRPEKVPQSFDELDPPIFNIANRNWWVKVLGMLSHNWALMDRGNNGSVIIYFFQDTAHGERPKVVDSLQFDGAIDAMRAMRRNGFLELRRNPGPWVDAEPRGYIWDGRMSGPRIYSEGGYWLEDSTDD
jgi:hypothetical protein